jgi:hypothetical protein
MMLSALYYLEMGSCKQGTRPCGACACITR